MSAASWPRCRHPYYFPEAIESIRLQAWLPDGSGCFLMVERLTCANVPPARRRSSMAVVVVVLILCGCGGPHVTVQRVPPTTRATPGSSPSQTSAPGLTATSQADNGQDPTILATYSGALSDFLIVAKRAPVRGNDGLLATHMAGDKLRTVVSSLLNLAASDEVDTGTITTLHAQVTQYTGTEAVVVACELDTTAVINATTMKIVTPSMNSTELVNELVQMTNGSWKETRGSQVSAGCS